MRKTKLTWWVFTTGAGIWLGSYLINGGWWRLVGMGACLAGAVQASIMLAKEKRSR